MSAFLAIFPGKILEIVSIAPALLEPAQTYLKIVGGACFLNALIPIFSSYLVVFGYTKQSLFASIIGNVINFILNFLDRPHGTTERPFSLYHIRDIHNAFQIPVHWHDELEIIYVKNGALSITISGENYIGNPDEVFVVSPGDLHFMGLQTGGVDCYTFLLLMWF